MPTFIKETNPIAKVEHTCMFCECKILPRQKYVRQTNVYDGQIYDWISHQECAKVANKLDMYEGCDDCGLDGESFREYIKDYLYEHHYDMECDDIDKDWQGSYYENVKMILKELI